ncbi:hypothetical protein [Burkholderia cenocepacia]|uniref:hypothetical protein n=1 Tax=Burkholderia cenocepacia TaxID=95486 RepID=UPI0011156ADC|nr:hypothetical protein [Burkholderia cenocepacia]
MIDFSRKFKLTKIEATPRSDAPTTYNYGMTAKDLTKIQKNLTRHVKHLVSNNFSIYFRKHGSKYLLHVCVDGITATINGVERNTVACSITDVIHADEFLKNTFKNHTEFLAYIGHGIHYLD